MSLTAGSYPDLSHLNQADWGPVIQFSSPKYYHSEDESVATVEVLRLGKLTDISVVFYKIVDTSGRVCEGGHDNVGKITFEVGQANHEIQIPLVARRVWTAATDFTVELQCEGSINAGFSQYGRSAQVRISSSRRFPAQGAAQHAYTRTKSHRTFENNVREAPLVELLVDYIRWNVSDSAVWRGTVKILLKDQVHNVYFVMKLVLNVWLVDRVLKPVQATAMAQDFQDHSASLYTIMVLMFLLCLPLAGLHVCDYDSITWRVAGRSRAKLQSALMQRFLNYEDASRSNLETGDLVMAMTRDTEQLVTGGFMNMLHIAMLLGKLIFIVLYQFAAPFIFGHAPSTAAALGCVLPTVLFPALTYCLNRRRRDLCAYLRQQYQAQTGIVRATVHAETNFRLVADFDKRGVVVQELERAVQQYNDACVDTLQFETNDLYIATWATTLMVALCTCVGGAQVLKGTLSLGVFLTGLHVCQQLGEAWVSVYRSVLEMHGSLPGLQRIVFLMNLASDDEDRRRIHDHCRNFMQETNLQNVAFGLRADSLPIIVHDVTCSYIVRGLEGQILRTVDVKLSDRFLIQQGQFVSIVGPRGGGKSTLLQVIGGAVLPKVDGASGYFVPRHLRVLHIGQEPMFFNGTLYDNLTLGVKAGNPDGRLERVLAVCRRLGVPEELLSHAGEDGEELAWNQVLSFSQRHLLSLARALIANPDVLVIHKPTLAFDEDASEKVLQLLQEFVKRRGIETDGFFSVSLKIAEGEPHGFRLAPRTPGGSEGATVEAVDEGSALHLWNRDPNNAGCIVEVGDVVVDVNGLPGDIAQQLESSRDGAHELRMTLCKAVAWNLRRPRTCVITNSKKLGVEMADEVYHVSMANGIQRLPKGEVTASMLL